MKKLYKFNKYVHSVTRDKHNNIFYRGDIDHNNILLLTRYVQEANYDKKCKFIDLHITSNGGSYEMGFLGYDLLKQSKKQINTFCEGSVCSAGTFIYLAGKKRYITPHSLILIHQLRSGHYGTFANLVDDMHNNKIFMDSMKKLYLKETMISEKQLDNLLVKDIYLTADETIKFGFVDKIII